MMRQMGCSEVYRQPELSPIAHLGKSASIASLNYYARLAERKKV